MGVISHDTILSLCELLHIQPSAFSSKWAEGRRRRQLYKKPPCDTLRRGAANTSQALIACSRTFAECEVAHTSLLAHFSKIRLIDLGQEAEIAQEPGFAFSFGVVLAMAGIILAITTWADYFPNPARNSAAPIPAKQAIYRAQHW